MPPKKRTRMISTVMQVGLLENQVQENVSKNEKLKLSRHATVHNNHLKSIIPGGVLNDLKGRSTKPSNASKGHKENVSKGKNPEPSALAPSNVHNKLPMGVPPGSKENASKGKNPDSSVLAPNTVHNKLPMGVPPGHKENASKGKNPEPSALAPSNVHNKLPMGVPPVSHNGQQAYVEGRRLGNAIAQGGGLGNVLIGQSSKPPVLTTSSNHKKLPLSKENGQQTYVEGRRLRSALAQSGHNFEPSVLAPSTVHNKLPMGVPPAPHNGQQAYVEGRRLGNAIGEGGGLGNFLKGQSLKPPVLTTSSNHKKLPLSNENGQKTYVEGRALGSALAQIGHNFEPSVLAPPTVHNMLPMGVPPVPHNGQQTYVEGRRLDSALAQGDVLVNEGCSPGPTPTVHNYGDANCQVFMSNEALHVINRAEVELEYTLVDPSREADRQVHLSREVLDAHYEEMNNNTTTTTFPTNSSNLRKTRGPTQETAVTPPKGKKWKCLIVDSQPVGQAASKLAIVLGLYARMEGYFPLHKQWKEQSPQSFKDVMKDIMRDYDFVDAEGMQANMTTVTHYCYESLKKKVRDWRFWLKTHFYIDGVPDEVVMKAPDKRVTQKNWELLLKYWERDDKILEAERNKRNRGEDRAMHTLGAKSIARHNHDEREKLGDDYTTLGAYLKAHQTKNGDYPDQYTRAMCEKVILSCAERDVTDSSDPCILSPILDVVYKGHHGGYERGRGLGWSRAMPWSKFEATASNESVQHLTLELQNARAEIEAMHVRERGLEESNKEMQARLERMEALWSMHFSDGSVGGSTSPSRTTHSQLPR